VKIRRRRSRAPTRSRPRCTRSEASSRRRAPICW
jgi:hypothetical protein